MCTAWSIKSTCTKKELQSLLGSLLYVAKCIKYARFFLNRMLTVLRQNFDNKHIVLSEEFKQDLQWFNRFLPVFNGISFFNYTPSKVIHLDACPTGLGAIYNHQVYAMADSKYRLSRNDQYIGCPKGLACPVGGPKSKLGFYVPFNSQGHIGTGPQNCHLWDSNPQR